jgi:hypothetical protein
MVDRLRETSRTPGAAGPVRRQRPAAPPTEFSSRAENYAEVDFLRSSEVRVDRIQNNGERGVYAQIDFVERLFVKASKAYIEFGVKHAILSISGAGPERIQQFDGFRLQDRERTGYVSLQELPEAVSVAMYASPGRALAELALPPTKDNYWSRIATAPPDARSDQLKAELRVSFSPHGLHITDSSSQPLSQTTRRKIEAIIAVAIEKRECVGHEGRVCRSVPIRERIP